MKVIDRECNHVKLKRIDYKSKSTVRARKKVAKMLATEMHTNDESIYSNSEVLRCGLKGKKRKNTVEEVIHHLG